MLTALEFLRPNGGEPKGPSLSDSSQVFCCVDRLITPKISARAHALQNHWRPLHELSA